MAAYILLSVYYWCSAFVETFRNARVRELEVLAAVTFAALAGLRFETGYDWVAYEDYFHNAPSLATMLIEWDIGAFGAMEPLYGVLNTLVKSLGLSFQTLLAIVSAFNTLVIFRFFRRYASHLIFCMAIYFCWVYLKIQMAAVRQSLCYSFLLIALDAILRGRTGRYYIWVLVASAFQYSGVFFLLLGPLLAMRISLKSVLALTAVGLIVFFGELNGVGILSPVLHALSIGFIHDKVDYYLAGALQESPAIHCLYAIGNLAFVIILRVWLNRHETRVHCIFFNLALSVVLLQLFAWQLPWLWNRVFYLAIVPHVCILSRLMAGARPTSRLFTTACTAAVSIAVLLHFVVRPISSLPYVPYQSYATYLVTGDVGDGHLRMAEYDAEMRDIKKR